MKIEDLVAQYEKLAQVRHEVKYEDKKSVKEGNKAVDKMEEIAISLNKTLEGREAFEKLLEKEDFNIKYNVAMNILNILNPDRRLEEKCISLIKDKALNENHLGYKYWLEDWEKRKNNTK